MSKRLFVFSILIVILAGCQADTTETLLPNTDQITGLPDTWTPEATTPPTQAPDQTGTPTMTPTDPVLTSPPPTVDPSLPTATFIPRTTPIPLLPGEEITISDIHMFSPSSGWAMGFQDNSISRVLSTRDGGQTWTDQTPPLEFSTKIGVSESPVTSYFWDESTAWLFYNQEIFTESPYVHRIWHTVDGGQSWIASSPLPFPVEAYMRLTPGEFFFIDPMQGWLRTHSGLVHMHDISHLFQTQDGGNTWTLVNRVGNGQIERLLNTEMAFDSLLEGWMLKDSLGGFEPFLEWSRNGGYWWDIIELPAPDGDWFSIDRRCIGSDPDILSDRSFRFLLICAPYDPEMGIYRLDIASKYLYHSLDLGVSWQIQKVPRNIEQIIFLNDQLGFAFGRTHYQTQDGGITWKEIKTVNWLGQFSFISPQEAWAVAREGDESALVHTTDGGKTYQLIEPVISE